MLGERTIDLDLGTLRTLASIACTIEEAAAVMGVSDDTLGDLMRADPEVRSTWNAGLAAGRASLRRLQWQHARREDSSGVQMTIHLSKHLLGQHEKALVHVTNPDSGAMTAHLDTSRLTVDEALALEELLAKCAQEPDRDGGGPGQAHFGGAPTRVQ